jgi:hypothetical protein
MENIDTDTIGFLVSWPCSQLFLSPAKSQTHDMHRQQRITSGELRSDNGPRRLLAYHRDPKG